MISIFIAGSAPSVSIYLEGAQIEIELEQQVVVPEWGGSRLVVEVDGREIRALGTELTLSIEQLQTWSFAIVGRPQGWDDPHETFGPPIGDRPVRIGLEIGQARTTIADLGICTDCELSLEWDKRENYSGVGVEGRYQREPRTLMLLPGHGWSLRRMFEALIPGLETPADELFDRARYKQVNFFKISGVAAVQQLISWTPYRLAATRRGLRVVNAVEVASPREIKILTGGASPILDIPTRVQVIGYQEVVDLTPAEDVGIERVELPDRTEVGLLELPAYSTQAVTSGTLTPLTAAVSRDGVVLSSTRTLADMLGDVMIRQDVRNMAWGAFEVARYSQATTGATTPLGGVIVESDGGGGAPAYSSVPSFGDVERTISWEIYDWPGAASYPTSGSDPWAALDQISTPPTGYRLGSVTEVLKSYAVEAAKFAYDAPTGTLTPREVDLAGDGRALADGAEIQVVARTFLLIEAAEDDAAKVGRQTTWEVAFARAPGSSYQFADGLPSGADTEQLRIIRTTTETYIRQGEAIYKITDTEPGNTVTERVDARPDRERLPFILDGDREARVIRRDVLKIEIDSGLAGKNHPDRLDVLDLEVPETMEECIIAGETYLALKCGIPVNVTAIAQRAMQEPGESIRVGEWNAVIHTKSITQEEGRAPIATIRALVPFKL